MIELQTPLKSILNFRDVGQFVNENAETVRLQTGLLYRSARPDEASFQDRQRLLNEYRVKSIIDLRTKTEHIEQAQKHEARIKASAAVPQTNKDVAEPLQITGIDYHEINFNGSAFSRMLLSKLSWFEFFKLAGLMILGYRKDAIKILAPHMEGMGLIGLAQQSLDVCTREVTQVFDVLGIEDSWPVLIHCTQGKDRTGLIVMLVLWLLQVDQAIIDKDYRLSEPELEPEMEGRLKEMASIGLSEQFAVCPPDVVNSTYSHIVEKYGSVEQYLEKAGVAKNKVDFVKKKLRADAS
ncbi:Protein tyrosine serine phosphatase [Pyrenophora tritici-repentis]|nr:Protein tyrosine-serine phosphatase [Pyrenophora tritici-repentis]KAI0614416.1 Protein tyrosine-serine phosphatase [Pyrenophora tritici-repentis]KAI0627833.1 Protein tyrosine-serine phosphatase [Pyrenophora tritici-repentis]KAI1547188.1 Protein tyrosine serine phosphatase [Pyrenophora tritici-repentis]KAI1557619.1 Protein tyrosine serine phosphatase [Pyrenophora tritici-repentis]